MDKAAFQALLADTLEDVLVDKLGVGFSDITSQFAIVNTTAQRAALSELGGLLDLQGEPLLTASQKLNEYVSKLAPHERQQYDRPENLVSLWKSMANTGTEVTRYNQAPSSAGTRTWKQSEIDDMSLEDFHAQEPEIQAAYLSGAVLNDVDPESDY